MKSKMTVSAIKSSSVCRDNGVLLVHVGFSIYDIGFQIHDWGLRIMLIWWHVCIHF